MAFGQKPNAKINFEKDMYITKQADSVQSNPIKLLDTILLRLYNILCTPRRRATQNRIKNIFTSHIWHSEFHQNE